MEDWKDGRDKRFQPSRLLQKINFYRAETEFFCVKSSEDASTHVAIRPRTDGQMTARILCARSRASSHLVRSLTRPSVLGPSVFGPPARASKLGFSTIGRTSAAFIRPSCAGT